MADICDCGRTIEQPSTGRKRKKCKICRPPQNKPKVPTLTMGLAPPVEGATPVSGGGSRRTLAEQTRAELTAAERLETHQGVSALMLAELLDAGGYNAQGASSMVKAHREAMAAALADAKRADDGVDELRDRRRRKAAGA